MCKKKGKKGAPSKWQWKKLRQALGESWTGGADEWQELLYPRARELVRGRESCSCLSWFGREGVYLRSDVFVILYIFQSLLNLYNILHFSFFCILSLHIEEFSGLLRAVWAEDVRRSGIKTYPVSPSCNLPILSRDRCAFSDCSCVYLLAAAGPNNVCLLTSLSVRLPLAWQFRALDRAPLPYLGRSSAHRALRPRPPPP